MLFELSIINVHTFMLNASIYEVCPILDNLFGIEICRKIINFYNTKTILTNKYYIKYVWINIFLVHFGNLYHCYKLIYQKN